MYWSQYSKTSKDNSRIVLWPSRRWPTWAPYASSSVDWHPDPLPTQAPPLPHLATPLPAPPPLHYSNSSSSLSSCFISRFARGCAMCQHLSSLSSPPSPPSQLISTERHRYIWVNPKVHHFCYGDCGPNPFRRFKGNAGYKDWSSANDYDLHAVFYLSILKCCHCCLYARGFGEETDRTTLKRRVWDSLWEKCFEQVTSRLLFWRNG